MKYVLSLLLTTFIFNLASSQDKLLFKNRDTLSVKVLSIENQKVTYQLDDKSAPKVSEFASLHKIIWRNGKEFIFDKDLDENLRKETIFKSKEMVVELKKQSAPKLSYKGTIFTKFYENGEKVSKYRVKEIIQFYDKTDFPLFQEGLNHENKAKKSGGAVLSALGILSLGRETLRSTNRVNSPNPANISKSNSNAFGGVLIVGLAASGITYVVMHIRANSLMQLAIDNYNSKQK